MHVLLGRGACDANRIDHDQVVERLGGRLRADSAQQLYATIGSYWEVYPT
jgi:hypothetical protein